MLILSLCFCLISCAEQVTYTFYRDKSEISSIQLVKITEEIWDDNSDYIVDYKMEILNEVMDINNFLNEFSSLICVRIDYLPGMELFEGEYGIKINYNDNSYELIGYSGGMYYKDGKYTLPEKCISFDEDEFNAFVEGYITYENQFEI